MSSVGAYEAKTLTLALPIGVEPPSRSLRFTSAYRLARTRNLSSSPTSRFRFPRATRSRVASES